MVGAVPASSAVGDGGFLWRELKHEITRETGEVTKTSNIERPTPNGRAGAAGDAAECGMAVVDFTGLNGCSVWCGRGRRLL